MIAGDVHTRFRRWNVAETGRLPWWLWLAWVLWSICEDSLHLTSHQFIFYTLSLALHEGIMYSGQPPVTQGRCASQIYGSVGNFPFFLSGPTAPIKHWYVGAYCQSHYRRDIAAVAKDECSTWDVFICESGWLDIKHMLGDHCEAQRPLQWDPTKVSWDPQWTRLSKWGDEVEILSLPQNDWCSLRTACCESAHVPEFCFHPGEIITSRWLGAIIR